MRTRTLILSGLLAALSGASAMAQVYSLNAVGYINVDVPPGFSIIADQLYATNQQTSQSLDNIFGPMLLNGGATTPDPYVGVEIWLWNYQYPAGYSSVLIVDQNPGQAPFWSNPTLATGSTFNPGQAAFIYNPGADFTMTFVGQVPQGTVTNTPLIQGFNMVSSVIPQTGAIDTDLGIVPGVGDMVWTFSTTPGIGNGAFSSVDIYDYNGQNYFWDLGYALTNVVGTGFFYYNNSATPNLWIRTFNIN